MKIFVCEFITSGGLYRAPLPLGLLREGLAMRDALLDDLIQLSDVEVLCCHDPRAGGPAYSVPLEREAAPLWRKMALAADAVWAIAPETAGALHGLAELATGLNRRWIGSTADAIALASSKLATCRALQAAGIRCVPTEAAAAWLQMADTAPRGRWVVKPDDGAGCEDTVCLDNTRALLEWLRQREPRGWVVQPFCDVEAASLSMLCRDGEAWLLSCNRQTVVLESGRFSYRGGVVNGLRAHWPLFEALARRIARALPGLAGYVGVDLLLEDGDPPRLTVLEINPRLTTSYIGLRRAITINPAGLVLDLFHASPASAFQLPEIGRSKVEITL